MKFYLIRLKGEKIPFSFDIGELLRQFPLEEYNFSKKARMMALLKREIMYINKEAGK